MTLQMRHVSPFDSAQGDMTTVLQGRFVFKPADNGRSADRPALLSEEIVNLSELTSLPNLVSLSRIAMIPLVGWFLSRDDATSVIVCALLIILAGISDGLDGYLARRMGKVSRLGIALDPIADKVFAGALVILLVIYRDLPLWLAVAIVGRDLLIVSIGGLLMRGRDISLPSNLSGKYAFASIAMLIGCYVIRFDYGITLFTWTTLVLLIASTIVYARVMVIVRRGGSPPAFADRPLYRTLRTIGTLIVAALFFYHLYLFLT
jgi:CDP-diacylglycerol--glycerol-3-phosphate 3-phosphatidyltransferase